MKLFDTLRTRTKQKSQPQQNSPSVAGSPHSGRVLVLDLLKGLLIIGMIFSHVQAELSLSISWLNSARWMIQLVVFSGFLFAFGYGTSKAYLEKATLPRRRILISIARILTAYLLSAFAYVFFDQHVVSFKSLLSIARLDTLAPYAEFLLTFVIILILILIVPQFFRTVARKDFVFWPVMVGLLIVASADYAQNKSVLLSLWIGSKSITSFPVLQYLPLYLFGIYFAQHKIHFSWKFLVGACFVLVVFIVARQYGLTSRFPPSVFWIAGSMGAVYLCYLISHPLLQVEILAKPLIDVGQHSLSWYLMSNLIIYSAQPVLRNITLPFHWVAAILIGVYFCIAFLSYLARA
jgi:peptidoglycan/LPS O-acetylase OafA/YrhL